MSAMSIFRRTPAGARHFSHLSRRPFAVTAASRHPRNDTQDRSSINTESSEYSKTGGDGAAADGAAFDPSQTRPEQQHEAAAQEAGAKGDSKADNPLEVSPANHDISQPRSTTKGRPEGSQSETGSSGASARSSRTSGGGSAPKSGGGNYGGSGSGA